MIQYFSTSLQCCVIIYIYKIYIYLIYLCLFWRLFDRLSKSFLSQMTLIVISSFDCSVSKDTKLSGTWWLLTRLKYGWRSRAIDRIWFYWISASTCPDILFIHRVSIHLNGSLSPRECWNISLKKKFYLRGLKDFVSSPSNV